MVLTNTSQFGNVYQIIKEDSLHGETVLILVSRDCDSIAACKILTEILKSDNISFNIKPVSGLDDLINVNDSLLTNDELRTVLMINCGGNLDIKELFSNSNADQLFYVIDSHRPYNANNIADQNNVLVIDDGNYVDEVAMETKDISMDDDMIDDEDEEDGDEEDEDEDENEKDEEEDDEEDDESEEEAMIKDFMDDEASEDEKEEEEDEKMKDNTPKKKSKPKKSKKSKVKSKKIKSKYHDESNLSSYGKSASTLMYGLCCSLMKEKLDGMLWYAIVGMTDQMVHERVSIKSYQTEYDYLRTLVLNAYPALSDTETAKYGEKERITPCEDYRFMLYRHWNLYDSLYNSKYVACTLKIWKAKGRHLLETLFALMGLPLEQSKQKYLSMNAQYKNNLRHQLLAHAPKFGLKDIYYHSFLKKYECSVDISASDTVYAVTALMESDNLDDDISDQEAWEQNFWDAYDSLSNKNVDLLMDGLKQSIYLQKEITRQVTTMIEKKIVFLTGPFRYAVLEDNVDIQHFNHPMSLTKLGLFMMDALISMGKSKKPFLIGALNQKRDSYLIVGISGSHSSDIKSNSFGIHFREAVGKTNSVLKYQSFDTSVIEIAKLDMPKFIEYLNQGLAATNDE